MRIRLLHPAFFTDATIARVSDFARLVFEGLWLLADREGRLADNVKAIDGAILSLDARSATTALDELANAGRILRYATPVGPVIQIVNFLRYQQPHPREKPSLFPAVGSANGSASDKATASTGLGPSVHDPVTVSVSTDRAPAARRSDTNRSQSTAERTLKRPRRVAPAGRAKRAGSAHVDVATLKKHFG